MLRKSSSGAGGLRESLRELLEAQEAPQRLPSAQGEPQERPKEVQNEPQEAPDDPQEEQNEPQEGQSELREVPGCFRERFGKDFQGIFKQRDATELLGSVAGLGALARPLSL